MSKTQTQDLLKDMAKELSKMRQEVSDNKRLIMQQTKDMNQQQRALQRQQKLTLEALAQIKQQQQQQQILLQLLHQQHYQQQHQQQLVIEQHKRDIDVLLNANKMNKDGTYQTKKLTRDDFEEGLRQILEKHDVANEYAFLGDMANTMCAEIMAKNAQYPTLGWQKLPVFIKTWASNEMEERMGKPPYSIAINRAKSQWMTRIMNLRWGNRNGKQQKGNRTLITKKRYTQSNDRFLLLLKYR
jgi:hypothetical protein